MPKNDLLITTKQVSELLGVDVRTVHRLTDSGALPHEIKVPGQTGAYLFDPDVVERFRQQRDAA